MQKAVSKEICEERKVTFTGLVSILFDRFIDMSADDRPADQKLYLNEENVVGVPAENIWSFLFAEKPGGCAKRFEGKKGSEYLMVGQSHISITPEFIPFIRDGKPIIFGRFDESGIDPLSGMKVLKHKGLLKKGTQVVPCPKTRPCLPTPWELEFTVSLYENRLITMTKLFNWMSRGGIEISLGTYRPRFGRFTVEMQ
jgi:hypothetical protein